MSSTWCILLGAFTLTVCSCTSSSDPSRGPQTPPLVAIGDTVSGALAAGGADTFGLRLSQPSLLAVYLQALDSNVVEVLIEGPGILGTPSTRASYSVQPPLEANRTSRILVSRDTLYRIIVRPPDETPREFRAGRYRFRPILVDSLPEDTPQAAPLGEVIAAEHFATSADVDTWLLGTPLTDTLGLILSLTLDPPGSTLPVEMYLREFRDFNSLKFTSTGDTTTFRSPLITRAAPTQWYLQMQLADPPFLQHLQPVLPTYRVRASVVDLRPERRPVLMPLADSLSLEAIDSVGDVDTYRVPHNLAPTPDHVFGLQVLGGSPEDTLQLTLEDLEQVQVLVATGSDTALLDRVTAPFTPRFGLDGSARVTATHLASPFASPTYRLVALPFSPGPETVPATVLPGNSVTAERIDFATDVDEFTFAGVANQTITLDFDIPTTFGGPLMLDLVTVGSVRRDPGEPLGSRPWTVTLPATGTYVIRLKDYVDRVGRGYYRLVLH